MAEIPGSNSHTKTTYWEFIFVKYALFVDIILYIPLYLALEALFWVNVIF